MRKMLAVIALLTMAQAAPDPHRPTPTYDVVAPALPGRLDDAVLIVSKTNAWRHLEHIPHSNAVLARIADDLGQASYVTENAAVFNDEQLRHFSVVVLNSTSGDFMTPDQRAALAAFVARGGGVVALHAAGDGSHADSWYTGTIIGAPYAGHPGGADQFQSARIIIDQPDHPVMAGVTLPWSPVDEWYAYTASPAASGMVVLARIDEATYRPAAGREMGSHPVIWTNPATKGRVLYSALGHLPDAYDDPNYQRILTNAIAWAGRHPSPGAE
ncbi:ThuA domain-containing protein [Croceibacterium sp. TMG7-5b_MA50]|uniref:ThuA domain-containing protein n=1 Tax=Croceibacterium sp. TMG7-5b_MA50 TaxID=3121290 RepID=UPI00322161F7